jgi:hypothetical protein
VWSVAVADGDDCASVVLASCPYRPANRRFAGFWIGTVVRVCALRIVRLSSLLVSFALAVGATSAVAGTYCVQDSACVAAGGSAELTIAAAVAAARGTAGLDQIKIGPGTFVEDGIDASTAVEIAGEGVGRTVIASTGGPGITALWLRDSASSVSDLTIALPTGNQHGLITTGTARRVAVTAPEGMTGTGVTLAQSGSFLDGSVRLPLVATWGVVSTNLSNAVSVKRSTIAASIGIWNVDTVQHVHVTAVNGIVAAAYDPPVVKVTVDDALVELPGPYGDALQVRIADSSVPKSATLIARHVTAIGNGGYDSTGIAVSADRNGSVPGTSTASVIASDVILRGFVTNLERIAVGGSDPAHTGVADITIDHSNFDPTKQWSSDWNPIGGGRASGTINVGPHNLNVDPLFRDPADGDFSLMPDSPLIDRGSLDPLVAEEPTTDLAGNPRVIDGDGDAVAIADMGAFEYVPPPTPQLLPATSSSATPTTSIAPVLTALSLRPDHFAVTSRDTADVAKHRHVHRPVHGTTIHFELSRSATVAFAVERQAFGRRVGGACVRPTRAVRRTRRCRRWVRLFTFSRDGRAGANAIPFGGHRPSGPLAPGTYRLRAIANADALSSPPATAGFAIVRAMKGPTSRPLRTR